LKECHRQQPDRQPAEGKFWRELHGKIDKSDPDESKELSLQSQGSSQDFRHGLPRSVL
jgi:hypothetical protein